MKRQRIEIPADIIRLVTLVAAFVLPVLGGIAVGRYYMDLVLDHSAVLLLLEFACMSVSLVLAGFFLLRQGDGDSTHRFWLAGSLLALGTMFGHHAVTLEAPETGLMHSVAVLYGAILAAMVWLPPGRLGEGVQRWLPLGVVCVCTATGIALQIYADDLVVLTAGAAGRIRLQFVNALAGVFFAASGARLMLLFWRHRNGSMLWMCVFTLFLGTGCLAMSISGYSYDWWFWQVTRLFAYAALVIYASSRTGKEFRRLDSASRELSQSATRFKAITENTSDIVFILGGSGVFTYVSPAAARVAGVREDELLGHQPGGYTHPEDLPKIFNGIKRATSRPGESIRIGTIRVQHSDGHWLHLEGLYTAMYDVPGVEGVVLNYRNITDRILSERALRKSRRQLTALIGNLPGMVYRCRADKDFSIEYVNDGAIKLTGYTPAEFVDERSVKSVDVIHPEDFPYVRTTIWECVQNRRSFELEYRIIAKDGTLKWVWEQGVGLYDEKGAMESVEGFILDVTERVQAEDKLRRTEYSINSASDAVYWIGLDGALVDVNDTACRVLGYSREELLTMNIHDISIDLVREDWGKVWEEVKRQGSVLIEGEHITKSGRVFPVEVSSSYQEFGGRRFHCAFVRDISERKAAEAQIQGMNQELELRVEERTTELQEAQAQLVTSEKMAALGNLVSGVAHEINTPLGIGITAASHLQQQVERFNRRYEGGVLNRAELETFLGAGREATHMILSNLNRAAELVQSFKQVSVDQSTEDLRSFNMGTYLREALVSLRPKLKQGGHRLELSCPDSLEMTSYPGVLAQVATNLVMNSLLHGFEDREGGSIIVNIDEIGEMVRILYRDDGQGMSSEQVRKIYDPFYTTKRGRGGSGLGMNIVFNLVTQMLGGTIECQSAQGQGTAFVIELPKRVRRVPKDPVEDGVLANV
ncbi:PAS domain S-box protein [bacterium]|nr:PAS domain S-box protein [bacterium]MBU1072201.1 PAS domain S-box protein [bacterium]